MEVAAIFARGLLDLIVDRILNGLNIPNSVFVVPQSRLCYIPCSTDPRR
jgi:hypothetical protein